MNRAEIEQELLRLWNTWSDFGADMNYPDENHYPDVYKLALIKQTLDWLDSIGYDNSHTYESADDAYNEHVALFGEDQITDV